MNYYVLNVTVCERCLRSSTVSSVSVFYCFCVQPCTNTMYFEWFSLTITPLPWCHDLFFILYAFALNYNVCMYPPCTTRAFAVIYILNYNVFPCALLVYNYNSLKECDLSFHFWKCDLDICIVILTCSFDLLIFALDLDLYWWYLW